MEIELIMNNISVNSASIHYLYFSFNEIKLPQQVYIIIESINKVKLESTKFKLFESPCIRLLKLMPLLIDSYNLDHIHRVWCG